MRNEIENGVLAQLAINEIHKLRAKTIPKELATEPKSHVPLRIAYLIDQIKHPDEITLLRTVYRNLFHVVGVVSTQSKRQERLIEHMSLSEASTVMERDRRQEEESGQQLDKALQVADYFIRNDKRNIEAIRKQIERFFNLLHGSNGITPTKHEYGMYVAHAAGLRSACLSRQVGAAISDVKGEIVATGCNDVPKGGGGLYSAEDAEKDNRCVHHEEKTCFNDREKNLLKKNIKAAIVAELPKLSNGQALTDAGIDLIIESVYGAARIADLIEFSRAVHAEMDAIISLARLGTPGIEGGNLYTTTFPCHSCARHIVAAGISKVYYIEPYEKSLAQRLHSDAISFDADDETNDLNHVKFIHFEGVSPRQYFNIFKMNKRKEKDGKIITLHSKIEATKVINEYLDDYRDFESKVIEHMTKILPALFSRAVPVAIEPAANDNKSDRT